MGHARSSRLYFFLLNQLSLPALLLLHLYYKDLTGFWNSYVLLVKFQNATDPHYLWTVCKFASSLQLVCNPRSIPAVLFTAIRTHAYMQSAENLSWPMHTILAEFGTLGTSNALACFKYSNFSSHTINKYPFCGLFTAMFFTFLCFVDSVV